MTGDDGNIYLLLRTTKPWVFVLSASGAGARRFQVEPPNDTAGALTLRAAPGQGLLIQFAEQTTGGRFNTRQSMFSLVNPLTGERMVDYVAPEEPAGAFACYTARGFLFLASRGDGRLMIRRGEAR